MKSTKSVGIFTKGRNVLVIMIMLTSFASFTITQSVFGAELPFGTVAICKEDASSGLRLNNGRWQQSEMARKTWIFKKVPLDGALDRVRYSGCPLDLRGEKDSYWENGMPEMLYRCYQFKTLTSTNPSERGCYEVYSQTGDLFNVNCDWGVVFHPEKELFGFPNYAIFGSMGEEYGVDSYQVSHGYCSKM